MQEQVNEIEPFWATTEHPLLRFKGLPLLVEGYKPSRGVNHDSWFSCRVRGRGDPILVCYRHLRRLHGVGSPEVYYTNERREDVFLSEEQVDGVAPIPESADESHTVKSKTEDKEVQGSLKAARAVRGEVVRVEHGVVCRSEDLPVYIEAAERVDEIPGLTDSDWEAVTDAQFEAVRLERLADGERRPDPSFAALTIALGTTGWSLSDHIDAELDS